MIERQFSMAPLIFCTSYKQNTSYPLFQTIFARTFPQLTALEDIVSPSGEKERQTH